MDKISVLFEIKSLEGMIARDFFKNFLDEKDIPKNVPTPTQMRIIEYILNCKDEVYQKDLEKVFDLRRATISGVLHTMEKNNLIIRTTSVSDSRTKTIKLSDKTKSIFVNNKKRLIELEKLMIKDISKNEIDYFIDIINKMKKNIENL